MRLAAAIGVVAVALAAAVLVHQHRVTTPHPACINSGAEVLLDRVACVSAGYGWNPAYRTPYSGKRPVWSEPLAAFLALGGVAAGVAIIAYGRRRSADAVAPLQPSG